MRTPARDWTLRRPEVAVPRSVRARVMCDYGSGEPVFADPRQIVPEPGAIEHESETAMSIVKPAVLALKSLAASSGLVG